MRTQGFLLLLLLVTACSADVRYMKQVTEEGDYKVDIYFDKESSEIKKSDFVNSLRSSHSNVRVFELFEKEKYESAISYYPSSKESWIKESKNLVDGSNFIFREIMQDSVPELGAVGELIYCIIPPGEIVETNGLIETFEGTEQVCWYPKESNTDEFYIRTQLPQISWISFFVFLGLIVAGAYSFSIYWKKKHKTH